jgi:GntR family transcriptional regulator, transcriptional repressor for pyruvate dehydrogenase complex
MIVKIKPVSRSSLSDEIVQQIIDLISSNALKPGERLPPERDLCKQFGVGRTSLREALRSLSVMGILDVRLGEGTFVSEGSKKYLERTLQWGLLLDPKIIEDLVEARIFLESQTAYLAAQRATAENLDEVEQTIQGMQANLDVSDRFLEYDLQFHSAVAKATQNSIFSYLLSTTRVHLQEWIKRSLAVPRKDKEYTPEAALREHKKVFRALCKHRPEEARAAMAEHIISRSAVFRSASKHPAGEKTTRMQKSRHSE